MRELEGLAPSQRDAVGPLSAEKLCVAALGHEQKRLGRGPEEERLLGTGACTWVSGGLTDGSEGPVLDHELSTEGKVPKAQILQFFLPCLKAIVGKEGNGCIVPGQSLKQEEVLLDVVDQGALHFLYHLEDSLKVIRLSPVALEGDASFGAYVPQFWWCMEQVLKHMEITVVVHGVALEHRCCGPGLLQDSPASTPSGPPHCSPNHHPARGDTHPG